MWYETKNVFIVRLNMTKEEFNKKYPIYTALKELDFIYIKKDTKIVMWDEYKNNVEELIFKSYSKISGVVEAWNEYYSPSYFNARYHVAFRSKEQKIELNCTCGAKHNRHFPEFHSFWCDEFRK